MTVVIPQWFEGKFSNWQVFASPPGFASTNNPLESFNKIIKLHFTQFDSKVILAFISIVINHLIPYYSLNEKEFIFYRIPHAKTKNIAKSLNTSRFQMRNITECIYNGLNQVQSNQPIFSNLSILSYIFSFFIGSFSAYILSISCFISNSTTVNFIFSCL